MRLFQVLIPLVAVLLVASSNAFAQDKAESPFEDMMINVLFNKVVQAELELVDGQKTQIQEMLDEMLEKRQEMKKQLNVLKRQGVDEETLKTERGAMVEEFDVDKRLAQKKVVSILLPHQVKRLRQVTAQLVNKHAIEETSDATGILAPEMIKLLDIDKEQATRIRTKSKSIQEKLAQDIKKLLADARKELLEELTPKQREIHKDIVGDPIDGEYTETNPALIEKRLNRNK